MKGVIRYFEQELRTDLKNFNDFYKEIFTQSYTKIENVKEWMN